MHGGAAVNCKIQELHQPWTEQVGLYVDIPDAILVAMTSRLHVENLYREVERSIITEYIRRQWHIIDWHISDSREVPLRRFTRVMAICTLWSCDPQWGFDH